ncbi:MAG: DNA polymerase III subunit delta [Paludibacteraceae bacterium]|nr:DNA polymerase III subunit delta [Paludibacteraceae bacterium]
MAQKGLTYASIMQQISMKQYAPIYVLMGEEPYYINKIVEALEANILSEDEKMMNLTVRYGNDVKSNKNGDIVGHIINDAQRYPMMSEYQVVILKEAQTVDKKDVFDKLQFYLQKPQPQTILIIAYKYDTIDRRKKWMQVADQMGVVFESKKLYENQVEQFIQEQLRQHQLQMDTDAVRMLLELAGSDLSLIESIVQKFSILLTDKKNITAELLEKTTGMSKKYSTFELQDALIAGNVVKANQIILHTNEPIQRIIATLFTYFANLMSYLYMADKSRAAELLRIQPWALRNYEAGARRFSKMQTFKIIGYLREYDGKSKGIGTADNDDTKLLKELVYKILH